MNEMDAMHVNIKQSVHSCSKCFYNYVSNLDTYVPD